MWNYWFTQPNAFGVIMCLVRPFGAWNGCGQVECGLFGTLLGPERTRGNVVVSVVQDRLRRQTGRSVPEEVVAVGERLSGGCLRIAQWMRASLWSSF
jgi:hypothetical protein